MEVRPDDSVDCYDALDEPKVEVKNGKPQGVSMPKALSFDSKEKIVAALKNQKWESDLARARENNKEDLGPLTAIYTSVGSSTFRSFRKYKDTSPSVVFRSWASTELFDSSFTEFRNIQSNGQYREWAFRLAKRLGKEWREQLKGDLSIPRALKLVNLLAKGLCVVTPIWPNQYKTIVPHIDVPLDQFSLRPLACIEELSHLNLRNASMGSVENRAQYTEIQDTIRQICREAGVPPIAYDLLMWDGAH